MRITADERGQGKGCAEGKSGAALVAQPQDRSGPVTTLVSSLVNAGVSVTYSERAARVGAALASDWAKAAGDLHALCLSTLYSGS